MPVGRDCGTIIANFLKCISAAAIVGWRFCIEVDGKVELMKCGLPLSYRHERSSVEIVDIRHVGKDDAQLCICMGGLKPLLLSDSIAGC